MVASTPLPFVPCWGCFERSFTSSRAYANPVQEVRLRVEFTAPSGRVYRIDSFWDGDHIWRVRFSPNEAGIWRYSSLCSDTSNNGLHRRRGTFRCSNGQPTGRFEAHGAVGIASNKHYLQHADGTPFFWLADTAWNGPMHATAPEWDAYLDVRVQQKFTAVQWVATQWLASPTGDRDGRCAYAGRDSIEINPAFFQQLDARCRAINRAGLLSAPVLLWAAEWHPDEAVRRTNPGVDLPESQAILLARYMVARWHAYHMLWMLAGDGNYRGEKAERWKRIGRAVFDGDTDALVVLHPEGWSYPYAEYADEAWLNVGGYQSCHSSAENSLGWMLTGELAQHAQAKPIRPILNLEPAYEHHVDLARPPERWTAAQVRNFLYWSLMVTPTAGVSYGGHGVWEWSDGTQPPIAHEHAGIGHHWRQALHMEAAEQIVHLANCFAGMDWWRLRPAPELIAIQTGDQHKADTITAARSADGTLALVYVPSGGRVTLNMTGLQADLSAFWYDPRTGNRFPVAQSDGDAGALFEAPDAQDWLLIFQASVTIPIRPNLS